MPNSPNRKRGRIGLTLAPDVMDILDKNGRCVATGYEIVAAGATDLKCERCGKGLLDEAHGSKRPTRTEIIEEAVREWNDRRK